MSRESTAAGPLRTRSALVADRGTWRRAGMRTKRWRPTTTFTSVRTARGRSGRQTAFAHDRFVANPIAGGASVARSKAIVRSHDRRHPNGAAQRRRRRAVAGGRQKSATALSRGLAIVAPSVTDRTRASPDALLPLVPRSSTDVGVEAEGPSAASLPARRRAPGISGGRSSTSESRSPPTAGGAREDRFGVR
jgi:hypothetical protein